jgi:hypothetical protein
MADIKQTVTRTEDTGVTPTGATVQQQTKHVQTESAPDTKTTIQNIIWYLLGLIEVLIALRFVLKLLGANSASSFVNFIYNVTGVLTAPFDSIFGVTEKTTGQTQSVFEPSILVAAVVYLLVAWGIVKFITINQKTKD